METADIIRPRCYFKVKAAHYRPASNVNVCRKRHQPIKLFEAGFVQFGKHTCRKMKSSYFTPVFLAFFALQAFSQNTSLYFPPKTGNTWQSIAPADLGFCPDRIDSLYHFLLINHTKSFILLQDGKIVLEKYFDTFTQDSFWYWASAGKTLTSFLIGQAQEEGLLNIENPVSDYLGNGWTACSPTQEEAITVWHQLTMTNGLDDNIPPTPSVPDPDNCTVPSCLTYLAPAGQRWAYHNAPYRLLHDVIEAAAGQTINQYTKSKVLDPVGMKGLWIDHIMYGRARDMARFGLLTLAGGVWNGDTLLHDQQYLYDATHRSQELNKSYGYLWWLNGQESFMLPGLQLVIPGMLVPEAPADMFAALGKNDQKIHVVPSKGWVVVRQGNVSNYTGVGGNYVPIYFDNDLWKYLNQLVCNPVGSQEPTGTTPYHISPNPAHDFWQIDRAHGIRQVCLYNNAGQLIQQQFPDNQEIITLSAGNVVNGVYWLQIRDTQGVQWVKLVK